LILALDLFGELFGLYLYSLIKTNLPAYNIIMLGEFLGYAYLFYLITRLQWLKKLAIALMAIFPIFWVIVVFALFGFSNWNSYVYVGGSIFIMLFAIVYYYELITNADIKRLSNNSEFWIATGLLIFYAGNLPFLGMYNFLIAHYRDLANNLTTVLKVLNIIMYSLFAYAYLCRTG